MDRPLMTALQRSLHTLFPLVLLAMPVALAPVYAFDASNRAQAQSKQGAVGPSEATEVAIAAPDDSIVIEAEPLDQPPTEEQLMQRFREALGSPRSLQLTEHSSAAGGIEVQSRYGRFCVNPTPAPSAGGPGWRCDACLALRRFLNARRLAKPRETSTRSQRCDRERPAALDSRARAAAFHDRHRRVRSDLARTPCHRRCEIVRSHTAR